MVKLLAQFFFLVLLLHVANNTTAQGSKLKSSIGYSPSPITSDPICSIPVYTGSFSISGYQKGEAVNDFTLYKQNGAAVNLKQELQKGKPVLLVTGNYTCPVFRGKISSLNQLYNTYQNKVTIYVVYVCEAHPLTDPSPYSGVEWTTSQNVTDGILERQPKTYGERLILAQKCDSAKNILPEIIVDGPCNNWWLKYGPAPNNSYLIDTSGIVFAKHDWFNKAPLNMSASIDSLLNDTSSGGNKDVTKGMFSFRLENGYTGLGNAGSSISVYGWLKSTNSYPVHIDLIRDKDVTHSGWQTAMCTDICLPASTDSADVYLYAGDSLQFIFHFYTDSIPTSDSARIVFKNRYNSLNTLNQKYKAISNISSGICDDLSFAAVEIYPNPIYPGHLFNIELQNEAIKEVKLYNLQSVEHFVEKVKSSAYRFPANICSGTYFLKVITNSDKVLFKRIVIL